MNKIISAIIQGVFLVIVALIGKYGWDELNKKGNYVIIKPNSNSTIPADDNEVIIIQSKNTSFGKNSLNINVEKQRILNEKN